MAVWLGDTASATQFNTDAAGIAAAINKLAFRGAAWCNEGFSQASHTTWVMSTLPWRLACVTNVSSTLKCVTDRTLAGAAAGDHW